MMSVMAAVTLPDDEEQLWLGKFGERWFNTACDEDRCRILNDEGLFGVSGVTVPKRKETVPLTGPASHEPFGGKGAGQRACGPSYGQPFWIRSATRR